MNVFYVGKLVSLALTPLRLHELRKDFERKPPVRKLDWSKVRPRQNPVIVIRGLNTMILYDTIRI